MTYDSSVRKLNTDRPSKLDTSHSHSERTHITSSLMSQPVTFTPYDNIDCENKNFVI